jgi:hypothetical protein
MSLEEQLSGVIAAGIPAPEDTETDVDLEQSADGVAGNEDDPSSDGEPSDKEDAKGERTIENVRRELLRKQQEEARRTRQELAQLGDLIKSVLGATTPSKKTVQSFDDYSLDELRGMRGQVPAEQLPQFDSIINKREIAETVNEKFSQMSEAEKYQRERERANKRAVEHYPQLKDRFSVLYTEVNRRLSTLDKNYIKYNPRIVLNLTEEVAGEMGIAPRQINRSRQISQPPSVDGKKPATGTAAESVIESDERLNVLAARLGTGKMKFDEAAMKRIKQRGIDYKKSMPKE